jgi:diguanylate cyclase (GGDEF)-like protein/PAS domain S-box-containing protein
MLAQFFRNQSDFIFFCYGLVFILLASVCITMRRDRTQVMPWAWLVMFGLTLGLAEWIEMIVAGFGSSTILAVAGQSLLMVAYLFLAEFGRLGLAGLGVKVPGRWIHIALICAACTGTYWGLPGLRAMTRYFIALPGALSVSAALYLAGRRNAGSGRPLRAAAVLTACFAFLAGLIVPAAPFFPASAINSDIFMSVTGVPIQFVKIFLVLSLVAAVWIHSQKAGRILLPDGRMQSGFFQFMAVLAVVLAAGWALTEHVGNGKNEEMRGEIRTQTSLAASAVNPRRLTGLAGGPSDLGNPDYIRLREQLLQMSAANPRIRWTYLMAQKDAGIVFVADSAPAGTAGHSEPGEPYRQPPKELSGVFASGRGIVAGPYSDEYGSFISGFEPVRDFGTGKIVSVFGIDVDAKAWGVLIARSRMAPICITMLMTLITAAFFVVRQRLWQSALMIAESEENLREAQRMAGIGSWSFDPSTKNIVWSGEMFRIFKREPRLGSPPYAEFLEMIHPDDRKRLNDSMRLTTREGKDYELELRALAGDGEVKYGIAKASARRGADGRVLQILGTVQDITGRKQAEDAVAESEERFRAIFQSSNDAMMLLNEKGFFDCNPRTLAMFGFSGKEQFTRLHPADISPPTQPDGKASLPAAQERLKAALARGHDRFEWTHRRSNGEDFPAEVLLSAFEHKGEMVLQATVRDITDRKKSEMEIRDNEEQFRVMSAAAQDAIIMMDNDGRITFWSQAAERIFGHRAQEVAGQDLHQLLPTAVYREGFMKAFPHWRMTGQGAAVGRTLELAARRKDGTEFPIEISLASMSMKGRWHAVATIRDITDRKKAEEEIRRANEKLSAMVRKLEERGAQNKVLGEMREFLQACTTTHEIGPVIERAMIKLFPGTDGALFMMSASRTDLESAVRWGGYPAEVDDNLFAPDDCWGLRRGGVYLVDDISTAVLCPHVKHPPEKSYACLPLMAKGDVLGVLHLRGLAAGSAGPGFIPELKEMSAALGELLSLSISNIKLRETLSLQSIKDPLTGLYNRRYMEETFLREIVRASRKQNQIGVIMVDIDHFKKFNDVFGHAAGDLVLSELARFFMARLRGGDIMCRYGGEEFALILPESSLENTFIRANQMVEQIKTLRVLYGGQVLGPITISMGVAAYPVHGEKPDDLLRAADAALYNAKQEGRDRAVTAVLA